MYLVQKFFGMLLIGLTGGIGTGKSVVSKIFRRHGITVVDTDEIAKAVVEPGRSAYRKLRDEFGDEFFNDEATGRQLKRQKLGQLIFNDPVKRRRLNAIVHPAIRREMIRQILKAASRLERIVVLDVPLFFESGYDRWISKSVLIVCDERKQVERVQARDSMSEADARARIAAQIPTAEKLKKAKYVIDNNGCLESTERQVELLISEFQASWQPIVVRAVFFSALMLISASTLGFLFFF